MAFSHDITPDMLRTKPDPDVEQRQNQFEQRASQVRLTSKEMVTPNVKKNYSYRFHQRQHRSKSMQ
jgi:hypothetical protein